MSKEQEGERLISSASPLSFPHLHHFDLPNAFRRSTR